MRPVVDGRGRELDKEPHRSRRGCGGVDGARQSERPSLSGRAGVVDLSPGAPTPTTGQQETPEATVAPEPDAAAQSFPRPGPKTATPSLDWTARRGRQSLTATAAGRNCGMVGRHRSWYQASREAFGFVPSCPDGTISLCHQVHAQARMTEYSPEESRARPAKRCDDGGVHRTTSESLT